jgi:ATP-dependent Zn protease
MKYSLATVAFLLGSPHALAFAPQTVSRFSSSTNTSPLRMALDNMPPPPDASSNIVVVQSNQNGQPSSVRYSDFVKLVNSDRIEKVTFSSDGTQLLGVDVDGTRVKIEALPNDPELLTQLTSHKVSSDFVFPNNI